MQKLEQETEKLQTFLDSPQSQTALKILKHNIAKEQYIKSFKLSKLVADYIEENNTIDDNLAYKHAYDITVCLGGEIAQNQDILAKLQSFLSDNGFLKAKKPLHDTFARFSLPENKEHVTLKKWQGLISKHGKEAMKLFAVSDEIEEKKAGDTGIHLAPENLQDAIFLQTQLTYERADEYPELAKLALKYKLSEEDFNQCLEIERQKKSFDNLPDITIHGKDLDCKLDSSTSLKGYHLVKLPINDPRAYILGHIVQDCQSIGGHSERCVIDGITRENNGFYVLLKSKNSAKPNAEIFTSDGKIDYQNFDIVGQAYAWLSKLGNLVLDSWENLRNEKEDEEDDEEENDEDEDEIEDEEEAKSLNDDKVIVPLLKEFAKQVCNTTNINRVTVGLGGKTPEKFKEIETEFPETILEGYDYGDATDQALIYQKPELTELENKINGYVAKTEFEFELNRIDIAKALLNLIENEPNFNDLLNNISHKLLKLLNVLAISSDLKKFNYDYFKEFLNLEADVIKQLGGFLEYYNKKYFMPHDLKDLGTERINNITSCNVIECYKQQYFTFDDLKDLDNKKIELLTSTRIQNSYRDQYFTFKDLKDLDSKKVELLTSIYTKWGYEKKYFTFEDLKNLNNKKIELLTSEISNKGYGNQYFTFEDLKILDLDKLTIATSTNIIECYESNYFKFKEFVELDIKRIKNICDDLFEYKMLLQKYCTFSELKDLSSDKIKALKNSFVVKGYDNKYFTFNDLKDLSLEKIKLLTLKDSVEAYEKQHCTFNDLKDINIEKIPILTSPSTVTTCQLGYYNFNDLKDLNLDKLEIAISMTSYYDIIKFKDFVELDVEKMQAIYNTRITCSKILKGKHCTFDDLKNIDENKMKALTSDMALMCYRSKYFTFNELKDLSLEIIQTLTSKKSYIHYKRKGFKFEDFKASLEKIEIADNHKIEISKNLEVSSFTDLVVNDHNHEENVDIIGRDL
ncbi:hypothetical protein [Rickettsia bellii]|uniref:hypothetical protein n=1 Tax=Rickettsia bellii TaxID=33990 RepID=UPI0000DB0DED|nr:hypothetical protein [Rickettsia bellii]